jgi:hypothetical protein
MVFDIPTSVTAAFFIEVAVPIALIVPPIALVVPIVTRLAIRAVTAVASVRDDHTGRQGKDTCDHDVASHTIERIHRLSKEPCMRVAGFALKLACDQVPATIYAHRAVIGAFPHTLRPFSAKTISEQPLPPRE